MELYERIIEIIIFVMSTVKINKTSLPDIDFKVLENLGYSQSEISAALSWILNAAEYKDKFTLADAPNLDKPIRILIDSEKSIFSREALEELINCVNLGLVTQEQMELIIEKLTLVGASNIDVSMVKSIVAALMFSQNLNNPNNQNIILHGNESIN